MFLPIRLEPFAQPPVDFRHTNVCIRYSSGMAGAGPNDMMFGALNRFNGRLGPLASGPGDESVFGMIAVWVAQCFSRGSIRLSSTDPSAQPIVEENMLSHPSDVARIRDGIRRLAVLGRHDSLKAIGRVTFVLPTNATDAEIDAYTLSNAGDADHATSTCRMGDPREKTTVVDSHCKVLGLEGLRVIDASIMPVMPTANTNAPAMMIGEKGADLIKRDLN